MATDYTAIAPSSLDFTLGDPVPAYIRCIDPAGGSSEPIEIQLPCVGDGTGRGVRFIVRNQRASKDVLLNAWQGEVIEGSLTTVRIRPGQTVEFFGCDCTTPHQQGVYGWEVIGLGLDNTPPISAAMLDTLLKQGGYIGSSGRQ